MFWCNTHWSHVSLLHRHRMGHAQIDVGSVGAVGDVGRPSNGTARALALIGAFGDRARVRAVAAIAATAIVCVPSGPIDRGRQLGASL